MNVALRDVTMENFYECIKLSVSEEQKSFVASNTFSLAEAKADGVSNPRAIYADDQMVGFVMYDFELKKNRGYITRLMIDSRFQGHGHGRAAMEQVIECLGQIPGCQEIQTSFTPGNAIAERLYTSLGFEHTGEVNEGEIVVRAPV